ncbi:MAG: T9SS type A sorting domain-containing protein [Saprospiraceae bacterium]|nr:T9SS type A sorting domain-containing protein [Saprospiraceae bacterium]
MIKHLLFRNPTTFFYNTGLIILFLIFSLPNNSWSQERPDSIQYILKSAPVTNTLATIRDRLRLPTDLAFHPDYSRKELWITNQDNVNTGGSTLTLFETNTPDQTSWWRRDGNAWHFMSLPTAIAFSSDNYNFATSTGVFDANHNGTDFTGPTLWSSDPDIYAQPSGGNGSHLDMLHGSPFSMGIAHEKDNAFWVNDTYWGSLVRYDFVNDHGPGNDYHADGKIWRYEEIRMRRLLDIPAHMVIDKDRRLLYAVDNGGNRVIVLNIDSGEKERELPLKNERLDEHFRMMNAEFEVILEDRFVQPCGIEIFDKYLLIGDYSNGHITVFDRNDDYNELGVIETEEGAGLTGIAVGPDGNIYYTNRTKHIAGVISADPQVVSTVDEKEQDIISISPNPVSSDHVTITTSREGVLRIYNSIGSVCREMKVNPESDTRINMSEYGKGAYYFVLTHEKGRASNTLINL